MAYQNTSISAGDECQRHTSKFTVLNDLMKSPDHSKIFKIQVSDPASTEDKIFTFMTGSYKKMHEIGSIFSSEAFQEDNLLFQLKQAKMQIVKFGPHLWDSKFIEHYDFTDQLLNYSKTIEYIKDKNNRWDLLIGRNMSFYQKKNFIFIYS